MAQDFKYKEELRIALYLVAALFIIYFFYDSYNICKNMSNYELIIKENPNILNNLNLEVNYKTTFGGQVWVIFMNATQIIFLIGFMIILYFHEILEKWNLKR